MSSKRKCGSCGVCCNLMRVEALDKPVRTNCTHFRVIRPTMGGRCRKYADRPDECRNFVCLWLTDYGVDRLMKPDRSGLLIVGYRLDGPVGQVVAVLEKKEGAFAAHLSELDQIMVRTKWPTSALILREDVDGTRYVVGGPWQRIAQYANWGKGTASTDPAHLRWTAGPVDTSGPVNTG